MEQQKNERFWLQAVYKNCEALGISRLVIERFEKHYLTEGMEQNDRVVATTKGA
ncbi:hypothetical protein [Lysinibacillus agricola]|uniref:hypothetical protein n=1 Tax=Lysinibacillus agricola TaxID=2590012 RepID=UPI003C2A8DB9